MPRVVELVDAHRAHRDAPLTFQIPSEKRLLALKPGEFVKVGFVLPAHIVSTLRVERMWVRLLRKEGRTKRWLGTLSNDPILFPAGLLKDGDLVAFEHCHILATET